jgi:hypothetical protein
MKDISRNLEIAKARIEWWIMLREAVLITGIGVRTVPNIPFSFTREVIRDPSLTFVLNAKKRMTMATANYELSHN